MATLTTPSDFRRHQKVVASVDLPEVPEGTPGKILHVVGLTWRRYHVLFDNGVQRANVDGGVLADRSEWEERGRERRRAERAAEQAALAAELKAKIASGEVAVGGGHH